MSDVCGLQNMWVPQALFGYRKRVYQVNPGRAFVRVSSVSGPSIGEGLGGFGLPNCCPGPFLAIVACSDFLLSAVARSRNAIRSVRNLCYMSMSAVVSVLDGWLFLQLCLQMTSVVLQEINRFLIKFTNYGFKIKISSLISMFLFIACGTFLNNRDIFFVYISKCLVLTN